MDSNHTIVYIMRHIDIGGQRINAATVQCTVKGGISLGAIKRILQHINHNAHIM